MVAKSLLYEHMPFTPDPRSAGATKKIFPFGETYEEIAKAGNENVEGIEFGVKNNPLFHKWFEYMRSTGYSEEILQKGDAAPLGVVQSAVIDAATPALIGRQISTMIRVDDIKLRLYRRKPAVGKKTASGSRSAGLGARYDTQDITVDTVLEEFGEWTREFVEDVPFPVALDDAAEVGRAVAEQESLLLFNALRAAADNSLHTSTYLTTTDSWLNVSAIAAIIRADNGIPNYLAVGGTDMATFWRSATFINNFHFGNQFDVNTGVFGQTYIGLKMIVSNQVTSSTGGSGTANTALIGNDAFIKEALRRDLLTEAYTSSQNIFGYRASIRMGAAAVKRWLRTSTPALLNNWYDFGRITALNV